MRYEHALLWMRMTDSLAPGRQRVSEMGTFHPGDLRAILQQLAAASSATA
jgi:hypothetical protein